jgi:hypothetical protein
MPALMGRVKKRLKVHYHASVFRTKALAAREAASRDCMCELEQRNRITLERGLAGTVQAPTVPMYTLCVDVGRTQLQNQYSPLYCILESDIPSN